MSSVNSNEFQNKLDSPDYQVQTKKAEMEDRYQAAFLFSAIGDALGWPTEFLTREKTEKISFDLPISDFVLWEKRVGGLWWGYRDKIEPGEYSDDTQLGLALARSINDSGTMEPERFAYFELPLWLHYERGGGRSVKAAARSLISPRATWQRNFYKRQDLDYWSAGANGAAMRNLPVALANSDDESRAIVDSFINTIVTHGHPNAILGSILFALAVRRVLKTHSEDPHENIAYLKGALHRSRSIFLRDSRIQNWIANWGYPKTKATQGFDTVYLESLRKVGDYLDLIPKYLDEPPEAYYHKTGSLDMRTKGSGIGTVSAALFLFLKQGKDPLEAIETAVNILGSDTDTISSFLGSLLGAQHGMGAIPSKLQSRIQDREYILKTALRIHAIVTGATTDKASARRPIQKQEAYLKMLAWEIGLHEMFWDAIDVGDIVVHPSLGRGKITLKHVEQMARANYSAKLLHVQFDIGQKCVFHSRMKGSVEVSSSLGREIEKGLESVSENVT